MTARTRGAALRLARTYAIVLAGILVVAWIASSVQSSARQASFDYSGARPTAAVVEGYALEYQSGGGEWSPLAVDADGRACEALAASQFLRDACVLATNVDPAWIASTAYGRLNNEDTPAFLAIVWRAALARDPSVCSRGGLLGPRLSGCEQGAASGRATASDASVAVRIDAAARR